LGDGTKRRGQVLEVDGERAVVQVITPSLFSKSIATYADMEEKLQWRVVGRSL
jgi:vacuolar-type H+-ATPase subunit B/Vma2